MRVTFWGTRGSIATPGPSTTVEVALEAGVRALALFHHDPMHDDDTMAAMVETARGLIEARGSSLHCFAAREERWSTSETRGITILAGTYARFRF